MKYNSIKNKNVIIINSNGGGGDFNRAIMMSESLSKNKYQVELISWNRGHEEIIVSKKRDYLIKRFSFQTIKIPKIGIIISYFIWWIFLFFYLFRKNNYICHVQGLFSYFPIFILKIFRKITVVYDLIDYVADSFVWNLPIKRIFQYMENYCIEYSEGVIVVDLYKQDLSKVKIKNIEVVTNCPIDIRKNLLSIEKSNDTFLIFYGGAIYKVRGIREVCNAIKDLENVKFYIAGNGPDLEEIRDFCKSQINVCYLGLLSGDEALKWTYKADVLPVFYDPIIPINRKASPAKLYDAMMCGTPVIVNCEAHQVAAIVKNEKCGLVVPYGDIKELRDAILKLMESQDIKKEMGENGRKGFETKYNWRIMEQRLINLYKKLGSQNND